MGIVAYVLAKKPQWSIAIIPTDAKRNKIKPLLILFFVNKPKI